MSNNQIKKSIIKESKEVQGVIKTSRACPVQIGCSLGLQCSLHYKKLRKKRLQLAINDKSKN